MSNAVAIVTQQKPAQVAGRFNWIQIFWIFVGLSLFISGVIAVYCMTKGGSLAWSTRFGVWVQVACNIR